ncbi:hypothetical protein [Pleomorphochaeta sp. DL1XJH-081]|jgi:hypothetical protein|uniref:hypothetical protein n=1 Tax=Pleomorphochaeta sp. DL1XJH-081 TaxID=3409690 RepID=UPI003BB683F8
MKRFTARETKAWVDALIDNPQSLYQGMIINKRGRTQGSDIPYSELVAKRLLHTHALPELLTNLPKVNKGYGFRPADHDGTTLDPTILGMEQEARVAVALYNHHLLGAMGKVIDYQIPIVVNEKEIGTIDLIAFDAKTRTLFTIGYSYHEEKRDTLLKCVLEIATLRNSINDEGLIRSYADLLVGDDGNLIDPKEVSVQSAVLFLEGSYQDRSVRALKRIPHVADLIVALGVRVFVIGIELQLRDKSRFNRKQVNYPYRPVFHFMPVLRERDIHVE